MTKPEKENITHRLVLSFCILMLIFLIFGLYSLYEIHTISNLTRTIYDHPLVVSNAALQSNVSIAKMHRDMKDIVLFKSSNQVQSSIAAMAQQEKRVYRYLDIVRDRILGDEGMKLEKETRTLFDNWRPIRKEIIELVRDGQRDTAAEITIGKDASHVAGLEEKMVALTNYARSKASIFMKEAEKTRTRLQVLLIIFLLLAITVSSLITIFTVTRTARAENELRESRQLLANAIGYAPIGMVLVEPGGKFHQVNDAFCEIIGYSAEEISGMRFQEITHPDDYDLGASVAQQLLEGKIQKIGFEKRYIKRDGSIINVYLTSSLLKDPKGAPLYFFTQIQNITERKQTEEALRRLNETLEQQVSERTELAETRAKQLRALASELMLVEQRERQRIAEILHDHLQQFLIAAKVNCEILCERIGAGHQQAAQNIVDLIIQSIRASRSLTYELSPPHLKHGQLSAALKWLVRWMEENHGLKTELTIAPGIDPTRNDMAVLLFQSIRELLLNVVKHARVKSTSVQMHCDNERCLRISVSDKGAGFDPDIVWKKIQDGTSFGLLSIYERLIMIGGSLAIESSPGSGATFSLVVPLENPIRETK